MATHYVRTFSFKDSLTDQEVIGELKFLTEEALPAIRKVNGVRAVNFYSGAGALRANLTVTFDMEDAGVYERVLMDADVRRLLGRAYGAWDMKTSNQLFLREITPQLIQALSGTG